MEIFFFELSVVNVDSQDEVFDESDAYTRYYDIEAGRIVRDINTVEEFTNSYNDNKELDNIPWTSGLRIDGKANQIHLTFDKDINIENLKNLNIWKEKAYNDILSSGRGGELIFFGDEAYERVSYLLATSSRT